MIVPRKFVKLMTDLYYIGALALGSEAFGSVINGPSAASVANGGSRVYTVLWGFIYLVSTYRVIARRDQVMMLLRNNKAILFLVGIFSASAYWSINRSATAHGAVTIILSTFFAIDFSLRYSIRRQLKLLCVSLLILMFASVIAEVVVPGFVPTDPDEGKIAWHGVFEFKNNFGRIICLCTVACLALSRRSTLRRATIFVGGVGLALLSKALSFVGYTMLLSSVLAGWSILKWRPKPRLFGILLVSTIAILSVTYAVNNFVALTTKLDKDPRLTGRVDLWQLAIADIQKQPLLGYGAWAFWGKDSQPANRIREAVNWDAPHAHQAYIDYVVSVGLLGLFAYLLAYCVVFKRALGYFMSGTEDYRRWPLTYLVFILIYQFTESGIVGGGNILWMLFTSIAFSLTLDKQDSLAEQEPLLFPTAA